MSIISIFLLLEPLIDIFTSLQINFNITSFSLGIIFKFLFLLVILYYYIFIVKIKNKKIIIYIFLISFFVFFNLFIVNGFAFENVSGLFRIMFFPISLLFIYEIYKHKNKVINKKILRLVALFYSLFIIVPVLTNTAFDSYAVAKKGSLGWFYSANEISAILAILLPSIFYYTFEKFKIYKLVPLIIVIISIFIIGTKTPLVSLLLCLLFFFVKYIIKCFFKKSYKKIICILFLFLTGLSLSIIFIPKTNIYKNTVIHLNFLKIEKVQELFDYKTIDHFVFGRRLTFLSENNEFYANSSFDKKLFGIGFCEEEKLVEMDIFDIFYRTGILGFMLFLLPVIQLLKHYKKNDKKYILSILMVLFSSVLAGHVLTAPSVSILVSIILCNSFFGKEAKKEVIITSYDLGIGGIETALINLLKNFNYSKYEATLVLEEKKGVFLKEAINLVKIKEYKASNNKNIYVRKIINLVKRISWIIRYGNYYDAGICFATYSLPGTFVVKSSAYNTILYVHSNYNLLYKNYYGKIKKFFDDRKVDEFDSLIFVSNESKNDFLGIYPNLESKSYVINNLINDDEIIFKSKEKINIKKNNMTILFVGRLEEDSKKVTRILKAAKLCKENKLNIDFWIVGDGPDKEKYCDFIKNSHLDNVLMLGAKTNPYPYMKKCDYVILTSRYEGFPVVYNEAIILKKPILTTIDVTDDEISIKNRFGIILSSKPQDIYEVLKKLSKEKFVLAEKIDFKKVNKNRILRLEKILESNND